MNPIHAIPARVRVLLYWIGYALGVVSTGITTVWAAVVAVTPDAKMPLLLLIVQGLVTLLVTQLNLLAGNNVSTDPGD